MDRQQDIAIPSRGEGLRESYASLSIAYNTAGAWRILDVDWHK
jgi:hypothetical protein